MKVWQSIILLFGHLAVIIAANATTNTFSQSNVTVSGDSDGGRIQSTTTLINGSDSGISISNHLGFRYY